MNDYSRDETEFGAFEDPAARPVWGAGAGLSSLGLSLLGTAIGADVPAFRDGTSRETEFGAFEDPAAIGGFFDKLLKPLKKKTDAKVHANLAAQGATAAQLALVRQAQAKMHVKPADVAKGVVKSAQIGMAVASFVVPGGAIAGTAALGGLVAADKLLAAGQRGVAAAKTTIDTTKKLAAAGHVDSQHGLQLLGMAGAVRSAKGIVSGVEQPVTAAGHAAYTSFLSARKPVVVKPAAPAPKPAAPPKLPAVKAPVAPSRAVAPVVARAPIAPVVPVRPALPLAPHPAAAAPAAAPKPGMTPAALQMMANTLSSIVRAGHMTPAAAQKLLDGAKAKLPAGVAASAAVLATQHQLDVAKAASPGTAGVPVLPAPAHDWLVTDEGKVQRVVRGNAVHVAGRGWYVGQFGLQRVGA